MESRVALELINGLVGTICDGLPCRTAAAACTAACECCCNPPSPAGLKRLLPNGDDAIDDDVNGDDVSADDVSGDVIGGRLTAGWWPPAAC